MIPDIFMLLVAMTGGHNAQTVMTIPSEKTVNISNTQAITQVPDYDEIEDVPGTTEKPSEKLHQEEKSLELMKSNNNYFTLMPQEEQESISNVNLSVIINFTVMCYAKNFPYTHMRSQ